MIEITSEIIGSGIEEEYFDAWQAISKLRDALGPHRLTNDTPEGRLLLELAWIEQQIAARSLPIPVHPSYVGTVNYLIGSGELNFYSGFQEAHKNLYRVLTGIGLMKQRHVPVLIAMIDDLLKDASNCASVTAEERAALSDLHGLAQQLREGRQWPVARSPQQYPFTMIDTPNLDECVDNFFGRNFEISASLFEGWRPRPARKPPLAAPLAGLPQQAPPLPETGVALP